MGKILLILFLTIKSSFLFAQIRLTIEGTAVNDNSTGTWIGVNIPRSVPTTFTYRNNSITSVNSVGYMLQAGDEQVGSTNNMLNGSVITGNKLIWNGTNSAGSAEGLFTGYNINDVIKYNYLKMVPLSIARKSNGMTNTSGGVAYNIVIDPKVGVIAKGINNVNIYNNTFYSTLTTNTSSSGTWRGLIDVYTNTDQGLNTPSTGTKIFNNIFYTKHQILNIYVYEDACLSGFESDYNVFYCEDGAPLFKVAGVTKTFTEWQAMGYDTHSVVSNPNFKDFINFVPTARLEYGTDLGTTWQTGLSVNAVWGTTDPATTNQNGTWQVGARVYPISTPSDNTPPTVSVFTIPATATSFTVNITKFTATDNIGVTGYLLTETSSSPSAASGSWTSSSPTTFTFSSPGSKILYAWAKDAAGNVSASVSATINITLPDSTPPKITAFAIPVISTLLSVNITNFTATDNVAVTGYLLTETSTSPSASSGSWTSSAPTSYSFSSPGSKMLYAWAKDAAGNVSVPASSTVKIILPDTSPPKVTAFVIPTTATTLVVPITSFTALDNVGVTGYLLTETATAPSAESTAWTSTAPTSYTFSSYGTKILYAWAKDAAGNVSASVSATVIINGNFKDTNVKIYPNPATDYINISINDTTLSTLIIRFIDLSGKIVFTKSLVQGNQIVQIPKNLQTSLYIVTVESANLPRQSQKLIIFK
jgi:hypothetical protein